MVSVCLPSDALLQHLPSYFGFSYLVCGVSLHGCSSKAQPLLLILDEGYLLTAAPPDLEHGIAPLGPPAHMQPPLLGRGVAPLSHRSWHWECGLTAIKILHKASLLGGLLLNICHLLFGASDFSTLSIIFSHFESKCLVTQDMVLVQTTTKKKVVKWCPQWPHTGRVIRD